MIEWTPIAVNEKPLLRGKNILPEYSAAVIGSSVVLRFYGGGLTALSVALTTIPFAAASEAAAWIEANRNRIALATTSELDPQ